MNDFIYLLKKVYAACALLAVVLALVGIPIVLAVEINPWWAVAEIITAPVGITLIAWGTVKIDEW